MEYIRESATKPLKLSAHNQQMEQVHKTFIKMALVNVQLVDIWLSSDLGLLRAPTQEEQVNSPHRFECIEVGGPARTKSSIAEDDCFGTLLLSIKRW